MSLFGSLAKMAMKDHLRKKIKERIKELQGELPQDSSRRTYRSIGRIDGLKEALQILEEYNKDD